MSFDGTPLLVGPGESLWGDETPIPGLGIQLLAGAEHTEGRFTLARYTISTEIYPHVHQNEDESIYLLDGEITVTVADQQYDMTPGAFMLLPRGVPHAIKCHTPSWHGLTISAPGGPFQACAEELLELQRSGDEVTIEALLAIQTKHGVINVSDEGKWLNMGAE